MSRISGEDQYAMVGPFGGLLPQYEKLAIEKAGYLAAIAPETQDYLSNSTFFSSYISNWCATMKANPGNTVFIALEFAGIMPGNDLLMPSSTSHLSCSVPSRSITIKSDIDNHYNMGESKFIAGTITDIISSKRLSGVIDDPRSSAVVELLTSIANGGLSISGIDFTLGGSSVTEQVKIVSQINGARVEIDLATRSISIDGMPIGYYESIAAGNLHGFEPILVSKLPESLAAKLESEAPGLKILDAYIALKDGKIQALSRITYQSGTLRGIFIASIELSNDSLQLEFLTEGSVLVNIMQGGVINWNLSKLQLQWRNGQFEGAINASGAMRMEYKHRQRAFTPESFDDLMKNIHSNTFQSLAQVVLLEQPFDANPTLLIIKHILQNNAEIDVTGQVEINADFNLLFKDGKTSMNLTLNGEAAGNASLLVFGLEAGKAFGGGEMSVILSSKDVGEYLDLAASGNASGAAHLLFLPIAGARGHASLSVRANLKPQTTPKGTASLHFIGTINILQAITFTEEEYSFEMTDYGTDSIDGRYRLSLDHRRWDPLSDARMTGFISFNILSDGFVHILDQNLYADGRGSGFGKCDGQNYYATGGYRRIDIPPAYLSCYAFVSVNLGCGQMTLLKTWIGNSQLSGIAMEY